MKYILGADGQTPIGVDLLTWAKWFETADQIIEQTQIDSNVTVSTVFIGIDHRFGSDGPPLLFETMIFGGPEDQYKDRYVSWSEAKAGHARAVELAKNPGAQP